MATKKPRVRFAPSPTGLMHLGNVRTALMNYLFAHQKNGTFVLRIEDTDPQRNMDPGAKKIIADLDWLNIAYDEGPEKDGKYGPYFQSERTKLYQEKLQELEKKDLIYRCFCTSEELEKNRQQQIALKMPPRYDRTCYNLSKTEIKEKLEQGIPFIWRMKVDPSQKIEVADLARGTITFDMSNFSDFPLTRQDGSFTFIFANGIDDIEMKITHVLRGEDHLTNTANQAVLYQAFESPLPIFLHLPILCNAEGKKLSKRDFGFSLQDLKVAGFLPEAIDNYLTIIGGGTFEQEIMPLEQLVNALDFDHIHSTGHVRYDVDKLRWINHKWIDRYDPKKLTQATRPFLEKEYPQVAKIDDKKLTDLIQAIKTDLTTLHDIPAALRFYFKIPKITKEKITEHILQKQHAQIASIIEKRLNDIADPDKFVEAIKQEAQQNKIPLKLIFTALRLALIGSAKGPSIHDLLAMLSTDDAKKRIQTIVKLLK